MIPFTWINLALSPEEARKLSYHLRENMKAYIHQYIFPLYIAKYTDPVILQQKLTGIDPSKVVDAWYIKQKKSIIRRNKKYIQHSTTKRELTLYVQEVLPELIAACITK